MTKDGDMDEDKEENKEEDKERVKNNDGNDDKNRDKDEDVDEKGMPSPPWAVRTRCSLLFPANKYLYVMVHQKPEHS